MFCQVCSSTLRAGDLFCSACGAVIPNHLPRAPVPDTRGRIAGERKFLTVLCSDLQRSTDLTMQVHSIDPPHPFILRSIELMAEKVAPALGWVRNDVGVRRVA